MAKKYDLVEVDGSFCLIGKGLESGTQGNLNIFPVNVGEDDGQINFAKKRGKSFYGEYLVTRGDLPFTSDGIYTPSGTTHYLGHRMSLEQFSTVLQSDLTESFEKMRKKKPEMGSNFTRPFSARIRGLFDRLVNGYDKLEELSEKSQEAILDTLDEQVPGFKGGYDYVVGKAKLEGDKLEQVMIDLIDRSESAKEQQPAQKKKSLDSIFLMPMRGLWHSIWLHKTQGSLCLSKSPLDSSVCDICSIKKQRNLLIKEHPAPLAATHQYKEGPHLDR